MLEMDKLLLVEIIRLKNMNKSLGQKLKHYDEMLYKKVKITVAQQSCLDFSGVVDSSNKNVNVGVNKTKEVE